jgi:thiol-disulfide isomerase/thioredoxin
VLAACAGPKATGSNVALTVLEVPPPPSTPPKDEDAAARSDRERLEKIMAQPGPDAAVANAIARFLPTTSSKVERSMIYMFLAKAYVATLKAGGELDSVVEEALCSAPTLTLVDTTAMLNAAYRIATEEVRLETAEQCFATVRATLPIPAGSPTLDPVAFARLQGTLSFLRGDATGAVAPLKLAATNVDMLDDPLLHLRLIRALMTTGTDKPAALADACARSKALYREHPLLPGIQQALGACSRDGQTVLSVVAEIDETRRQRLLSTRRNGGEATRPLSVEDAVHEPTDLELKDPAKVTVVAFFSTWCPHCNKELPRLNEFALLLESPALKDRVRLLGIRTSVEREIGPWEDFVARLKPAFPIWTDPTLSLAFAGFCKTQGLKPSLPTVAVVDTAGVVRFVLGAGDYQHTAQELTWAVQALLDQPTADKP